MGGGRWGWAAALAIAAGTGGCDEGGAPARGFHSRQLVSTRDPTLSLVGFGSKIVTVETNNGPTSQHVADPDTAYYATGGAPPDRTYWQVSLTDGTVTELGDQIVSPQPPGPREGIDCRYEGIGTTGVYTLFVIDAATGQDIVSIDRVVGAFSCPRYPDRYLAVVRLDENDVGRLWTGPFDGLVRAALELAIDEQISSNWHSEPDPTKQRMTVLAAPGPAPAGRGLYDIDLAQLTATEVIPPALADVTWVPGAPPSGSVRSDGLARANIEIVYASGGSRSYLYSRLMNDGSEVMFAGPLDPSTSPPSRELALFPIAGETARVFLANVNFLTLGRNVITWHQRGASGSDTDLMVNWDTTNQRIISCPFPHGTLPVLVSADRTLLTGVVSPDRSRYAFADYEALRPRSDPAGHGPLIELVTAGAGSCALLASKDVKDVVLADEGLVWIEAPSEVGTQTLWLARAPGDAPRALGSMVLLEAPQFIAPNVLQVQLGADLAWLDVRDDPVKLTYVAERVFGIPTVGPRWLIIGYGLSSQDGTGTLGVVDWHSGDKHPISPSVLDFMVSSPRTSTLPLNIVYRVRGRSASPQDGLWAATIEGGDLP
jgi:hypothetical protein